MEERKNVLYNLRYSMGEISKPTKLARGKNQIQKIMAANWPP
jgi:hypothetical protein